MKIRKHEKVHEEMDNKSIGKALEDLAAQIDPNGSYTGNPVDGGEPIQDADDL